MDLIDYVNCAKDILHDNTKYSNDKRIIEKIFEFTKNKHSREWIITRLTIIDSYYSTQMNKRYYGIEDIADKMMDLFKKDEKRVINEFIEYAKNPSDNDINKLFAEKNYGIHKNGTDAGQAISLISKYGYYQTEFKFPIYDNLVREVLPLIFKKYFNTIINKNDLSNISYYINQINQLKDNINNIDYDALDNFLWLTGKIKNGNFSLIISEKEAYKVLAKAVEENTEAKDIKGKVQDFSNRISEYINKTDNLKSIIKDEELLKFIDFVKELNADKR